MTLSSPGLGSMAWPTVMMLVSLAAPASPFMSSHCYFNPLCTCKLQAASPGQGLHNTTEPASPLNAIQSLMQAPVDIRDVSCLGVPFARIPDIPVPYLTHIDLVDAGLEVLNSDQIK